MVQGDGPTGITVKTLVSLLRIGDVKIVCMPGELFPELAYKTGESTGVSATVKEILGEDFMVMGLFDDEIGYIVPPKDFLLHDKNPYFEKASSGHYEETNSLGPQTAGILLDTLA